jgi:hypothetical protein
MAAFMLGSNPNWSKFNKRILLGFVSQVALSAQIGFKIHVIGYGADADGESIKAYH